MMQYFEEVVVMAKRKFKAESGRLLDLMINSIYTHKEIFLRELISNASDAIDKLYFTSLTDENVGMSREDFKIRIDIDKEGRTLSISDNGIGMTKDELENNLGVICKSGTLAFKSEHDIKDDIDVIGQFGVGFYSAFMVSKKVKVTSRAYGEEQAYIWESAGDDGYMVKETQKDEVGTKIELTLKDDTDDEKFSEYLDEYRISALVKKYSDYIRYPIYMVMEKTVEASDGKGYEKVMEDTVLNSMVPLWRRNKKDITEEEYNTFYRDKFFDYNEPLHVINVKTEGLVSYNAILYIPKKPPYDFYTKEYKRGLQLYSNNVMIMENCEDLLPSYFGFVKGVVESSDLSLNISREMLQHDRQLKVIANSLKKKIQSELLKLQKDDREKYEQFFESFGATIKYGMYEGYGANKDFLKDLVLYYSDKQDKMITLKEYVEAMIEGQKDIYYVCGDDRNRILHLPQTERVREKGYDILCMTDDVDEFAVKLLDSYDEKKFKSVSDNDLDLETEEEKKELEQKNKENEDVLSRIKDALKGKVKDVRLSKRLKNSAVCLVSDGMLSIEMEKVLNSMPMENGAKAERILEINPDHPVFKAICGIDKADEDKIKLYSSLLYQQALLIEGLNVEDPVAFSNEICSLMAK